MYKCAKNNKIIKDNRSHTKIGDSKMGFEKLVDKAWEDKTFKEIADAPVSAIQGVSEGDADYLQKAFNIKTVRDFANHKFVKWAQALTILADYE